MCRTVQTYAQRLLLRQSFGNFETRREFQFIMKIDTVRRRPLVPRRPLWRESSLWSNWSKIEAVRLSLLHGGDLFIYPIVPSGLIVVLCLLPIFLKFQGEIIFYLNSVHALKTFRVNSIFCGLNNEFSQLNRGIKKEKEKKEKKNLKPAHEVKRSESKHSLKHASICSPFDASYLMTAV